MRYFGVPTCPYCRKRVNLIRTWSLKRQGEYQCPRCGGISNIYLSPLIYVLGLMAVFAGGVLYFFHKFVLDDISLKTVLYVFLPFGVFFLFSLFMVYLEKPVIKKISREEYEKKRRFRPRPEETPAANPPPGPEYKTYFEDAPQAAPSRGQARPGPAPQQGSQGVVNQQAFSRAKQQAELENSQRMNLPRRPAPPRQEPRRPVQPVQPAPRRQGMQGISQVQGAQGAQGRAGQPGGYGAAGIHQPPVGAARQGLSFAQQGSAEQHRAGQQAKGPGPAGGVGRNGLQ